MKHRRQSPRATPIPIVPLKNTREQFCSANGRGKGQYPCLKGGDAFTFWAFVADARRTVRHKKEVAIKIIFASIVIGPLMLVGALPAAADLN